MKCQKLLGIFVAAGLTASAFAADPAMPGDKATSSTAVFKTEIEQVSYCIGTDIGTSFKKMGIEVNLAVFNQALEAALAGKQPAMSKEEMAKIMDAYQAKLKAQMEEKSTSEGKKYLEENAKKAGVKTTASGLQYKVIKEGTGATPKATDTVKTHYKGTFISGEEFDSSYKRNEPAEFPLNGVIKGWTEALQLMKEGAKYEIVVPAELAYGEGRPGIPPNSVLIFEIELLSIVKPDAAETAPGLTAPEAK